MDRTRRRRRVIIGLGGPVLALVVAAACTGGWPPRHPTTTGQPSTTGTTIPSPTTATTIVGAIDCGTIAYASGWPTTTMAVPGQGPLRCMADAWEAGTPAKLVTRQQTDGQGGHILITTYEVVGRQRVRVTTDGTGAQPPRPVLVQECTSLDLTQPVPQAGGCTPQPPAAPPLDGKDCGTIFYATGWPTTPPQRIDVGPGRCLLDAWEAGTPARLTTRDQTDGRGGHIRIVIYDVLGPGDLRVTTDNRQTVDPGDPPVIVERCTGLSAGTSRLQPEGCTPA